MAKKKKEKNFSSFLNNPIDFTLVITILLLLGIGLVMVLSASSPSALAESGNSYSYFSKQLIFAILGLIAMFFISKIDYRFYKKFYIQALVLSVILLLAVLVVGKEVNGSKRWIYITSTFSFQPSEIVKFLMIIFYAGILTNNVSKLKSYKGGFLFHIIWVLPIVALLLKQPHLSASLVIIGFVCVMMIVAGCKFKHFLFTGLGAGLPALIFLIAKEPYRLKRFITFLDPWQDKTGDGWQVIQRDRKSVV